MRNTDEQLQEILRRAEVVKEKRAIRKHIRTSAMSVCVCLALLISAFVNLPRLSELTEGTVMSLCGSLLLTTSHMGCVVVGAIAFALGVCVTLLCIRWNELIRKERDENDRRRSDQHA